MNKKPTQEAIDLYDALTNKGIKCVLEHPSDGHKHIDIRLIEAKIDIEVDGDENVTEPTRSESDVKRRYWSYREGFVTIHIPNHIVNQKLDKVADAIFQVAMTRKGLLNQQNKI